jgi:roadblock/LC7 domain-containing protein
MATLQGLLDIEGVGAAGEFSLDGSLLDYEARLAPAPRVLE